MNLEANLLHLERKCYWFAKTIFKQKLFIKFPYLLENFNLHRKELKDINGRYVTTTILHNEEISDIYDTLKEQVSKNIKIENTLQEFIKLSPEDQSKVLTKAAQLKEAN